MDMSYHKTFSFQLYTLKDIIMQHLNKVYRMVYELWRFFLSKNGLFSEMRNVDVYELS
jgi:hypothetical protein